MTVQVVRAAKADIASSHKFYENQQQGLGNYFVECILADIAELEKTGGIHRQTHGYHHVNSKRFQSVLYYRMVDETVILTAIIDGRINPARRDRILSRRH
ncbi:MAG: type II toxin-antitoxin system RelE/ParE family toxin [Verrucomicrobia bacterium]|nr:type II toxin-antitoxin system RelE/ParE family toxin [Verrucomicrobiota bacterium]